MGCSSTVCRGAFFFIWGGKM